MKEIVPAAFKVADFINPNDQNANLQMHSAKPAADKLDLQLEPVLSIRNSGELKSAFETATRARGDAALRMVDPVATD